MASVFRTAKAGGDARAVRDVADEVVASSERHSVPICKHPSVIKFAWIRAFQ